VSARKQSFYSSLIKIINGQLIGMRTKHIREICTSFKVFYFYGIIFILFACNQKQARNFHMKKHQFFDEIDFTKKVEDSIRNGIQKQAKLLENKLKKSHVPLGQISFQLDTFVISNFPQAKLNYYSSTNGINEVIKEETNQYDSLMNLYYIRLLQNLHPKDQNILIEAQKAWLSFRDKELELYGLLREEQYSGGGTMQSNVFLSQKCELIKNRMVEIFNLLSEL
jgi:uncharacterized protein YecT (DUF1311 family)